MTELAQRPHRVIAALAAARAALAEAHDAPVWSMAGPEVDLAMAEADALEAQAAALRSRVLRQAKALDLPGDLGARSVAAWDARTSRVNRRTGHRRAYLAEGLEAHPLTDRALSHGELQVEQAEAILRSLDRLPADLDPELTTKAESFLIEHAAEHDAMALTALGQAVLEYVAPEVADAHLAKQLARSAAEDEEANRLYVWDTPDGRVRGKFDLDGYSGACFRKAMFALSAPKHRAAKGPLGERKPTAERLGEAFAEYVRRYPTEKLPDAGGLNATVVVLMQLETLMGGLKAAKLDTGELMSPGLARRIACETAIIPAVLGGKSEVLDLGRSKRLHSKAQRIVATIEQGGCIAEGHDCPPAFTQMHHPDAWSKGGETNRDGWMLCPPAHRLVHDPRYIHQRLPNGRVRFTRRT
jgi:hypothetical protein